MLQYSLKNFQPTLETKQAVYAPEMLIPNWVIWNLLTSQMAQTYLDISYQIKKYIFGSGLTYGGSGGSE